MQRTLLTAALLLGAVPALAQAPVIDQDSFRAGTTAALGRLCAADAATMPGTAAAVYCHGFLAGIAQFHAAMSGTGGAMPPLYCPPQPLPLVAEVATAFATWTVANPQYAQEPAVDGLMRFAVARFPCPPATRAARPATRR